MNRNRFYMLVVAALLVGLAPTAHAARHPQAQSPAASSAPGPTISAITFALAPTGLSDIAIALDISATIADADDLAMFIEVEGNAVTGSVQQLLKWDTATQTFLAYSHQYGYGDNFDVKLGDVIFLIAQDGPSSVTFTGRKPDPGEVTYALTAAPSETECALNFISLPLDQAQIADADKLSDSIGGVAQALDWDATTQSMLAWSNEHNFGDNFIVEPGHAYMVCVNEAAPKQWP